MAEPDAFDELGWVVQCVCCGRKQHFPMQSRNLAMGAATAQGWRLVNIARFEEHVANEKCPECKEAGK